MPRRRSDQDQDLQAVVWDQIPAVACRGLCASSCGPIDASGREKQRLRERGVRLPPRVQALRELSETGDEPLPTPEMIAQAMHTPDVLAAVHRLLHRPRS